MNLDIKISKRIVQQSSSIIQTLKLMDTNKFKLMFVYNDTVFVGMISIGDIQRAIINNVDLKEKIISILDYNKIYAKYKSIPLMITQDTPSLREKLVNLYVKIAFNIETVISSKATIFSKLTIGNKVIVGVGAVVTKDIDAYKIEKGVPAK